MDGRKLFFTGNNWGLGTKEQLQHVQDKLKAIRIGNAAAFFYLCHKETTSTNI